jgi:hypothetical protein
MKVAHDIYAEVNPAYCTYALAAFTKTYMSVSSDGPELATVYLALPLALSGDLGGSFDGTNKNTGLLEWLERSPQVQIALAERMNASIDIVTEAVRFACFTQVLVLNERARLTLGSLKVQKRALISLGEEAAQPIKRAERLGYWFALVGSTRTVFDMIGLAL